MNRIRRTIISIAALLLFVLVPFKFSANASSNADAILSALRSGVEVNGITVTLPAGYINQAENYFASHSITDAQASYILGEIGGAKEAIRAAGVTDLKKMDKNTKMQILSAAQAAADKISLKLTVGADKTVKIADSNGKVAFSDSNPIKTTGLQVDYSLPVFAGAVLIFCFAGSVILTCKFGLLAKE